MGEPLVKQIELDPREYQADIPNKREPFFGPDAFRVIAGLLWWGVIAFAVRYFLHR